MINIHNIMEEHVITRVNDLYNQVKAKNSAWLSCDCENCRLDTITYVLNRTQPKYVVSGRGLTHASNFIHENTQLIADIDKLCVEGMRLVNNAKRPYHSEDRGTNNVIESKNATFNFPTFFGNIFDVNSFEPIIDAKVLLKINGKVAEMMDITWPNPCITYAATKGSYTFWTNPIIADDEGLKRKFDFSVEVTAYGYQPAIYNFTIPLISEKIDRRELNSSYSVKIQDIFLSRDEEE